jgi:AraC-like DNA-binding protein
MAKNLSTASLAPAPRTALEQTRPTGHGRARGLVSSRRSGSRVEAHTFAPTPVLRHVVAGYWTTEWDLRGQPPHVAELLGDPCVHLVLEAGCSRVVGVWTRLWRRTLEGHGRIRAVKLRAGAVRAFVARPACELTDGILPLGAVIPCDVDELERAVLGPRDDARALARLERWVTSVLRDGDASSPELELATTLVDRLTTDLSITTVEALAGWAGMGKRPLQRLFREHVGAPPKWLIRRVRLQEAALRIERGDGPSLAALAAELGYADQAHLARDFKRAVGRSPGEFAKSVHR